MHELDDHPGHSREKKQQTDAPVKQKEQAYHGRQRDHGLQQPRQAVDDAGGAVRSLLLGPVQGVVIFGVFVIGEIEGDGFSMQQTRHIVSHHRSLALRHVLAKTAGCSLEHRNPGCSRNEIRHLRQCAACRPALYGKGHPIDDQFQQIERRQREQALDHSQNHGQNRPSGTRPPDQQERPVDAKGVLEFGFERHFGEE